ncbi:hypothetical protein MKX03_022203 [Papaver bracteatum]|nr:hypothetical protein MKX03_022203 [Papaver bracteatum]
MASRHLFSFKVSIIYSLSLCSSPINGHVNNQYKERTTKPQAFKIINDLRSCILKACGPIVSCADITALLCGGPIYPVPLGRRTRWTCFCNSSSNTSELTPPPFRKYTSALITALAAKNLDTTDLVALSGAHTIGIESCGSFTSRLYPTQDSTMDQTFANNLRVTCPKADTSNTTVLNIRSPNVFDNKYYVDLMNRQGLFVRKNKFVFSMIKMGQLNVLAGNQGQIPANCSSRNPSSSSYLSSVVDEVEDHQDIVSFV